MWPERLMKTMFHSDGIPQNIFGSSANQKFRGNLKNTNEDASSKTFPTKLLKMT